MADFEGYCSVDQYVFRVGDAIVPEYVAAFMRSPTFLAKAPIDETPGQLPRIRLDEILDVRIDLPVDAEEQHRVAVQVAEQLAVVDSARAASASRRDTAHGLVQGCLAQALEGSLVGWQEVQLRDAVKIQLGKMLSPASRTGLRPVPYLRNANVQWDRFELTEVHEMDFAEEEERKFLLQPGDLLVCEGGEPGRAAIWSGEINRCCYQKALHRLRPIADHADPRFLMYRLWLGALRGEFTGDHAATTIAHLPAIRLAGLTVRLPLIDEQRRIAAELRDRLAAIDSMTQAIEAELETIEALPAAMLRRAFADVAP
ncbi:MAG: restriction endonuclease subunit S [Chloroflexi bacterium]|nr:restriction endonuclease subunit S [Chloroflexota bacterium]